MNKAATERLVALTDLSQGGKDAYQACHKDRIVLHHTVSGEGIAGDLAHWAENGNKIGTAIIIARKDDGKGIIKSVFPAGKWRYHLGVSAEQMKKHGCLLTNSQLNSSSIGIELDSWGALTFAKNKYLSYTLKEIPKDRVQLYENPWRGAMYYEKYTDEQIRASETAIYAYHEIYGIDISYHDYIFQESPRPFAQGGIYSHSAFVPFKQDIHPQPELVQMLKSLKNA